MNAARIEIELYRRAKMSRLRAPSAPRRVSWLPLIRGVAFFFSAGVTVVALSIVSGNPARASSATSAKPQIVAHATPVHVERGESVSMAGPSSTIGD